MAEVVERGVKLPHLRAWRRDRGLTQGELAAAAKIAPSTIMRAERGDAVRLPNARRLAAALGIEYRQLVKESPEADDTKAEPAA